MLCPSCHSNRPANYELCPFCYAPSPLMNGNFNNAPQVMTPPSMQGVDDYEAEPASRVLVPYSGQQSVPVVRTNQFPTIHTGEDQRIVVPPGPLEPAPLHVPPMYTKPRPIVPRYRIISGLISFFVVIGLLCGGSIYYAQATGRLGFLQQLVNPQFQNLQTTKAVPLPTPATQVVYASNPVITSAAAASSIDANNQPQIPTNKFYAGKPIFVTFSVRANKAGKVTFNWYTNNTFFYSSSPISIPQAKNGGSVSDSVEAYYYRSAEGKVELLWNGAPQVTLYFVVEPAP